MNPNVYLNSTPLAERVYREDPLLARRLYSAEVYQYLRDGVVVLPGVIDLSLLEVFDRDLSLFMDLKAAPALLGQIRVDGRAEHKEAGVLANLDLTDVRDGLSGLRLNDLQCHFYSAAQISLAEPITSFLSELFGTPPALLQSLTFFKSSEQPLHQDFSYVNSHARLAELAAAWIPLEDIHPDSGPLIYYPGSHFPDRAGFFDWGNGSVVADYSTINDYYSSYDEYLRRVVADGGFDSVAYLPKRGDLLIWHGALIHGGSPILNQSLTRRSYVCHYTSLASHPRMDRFRHQEGFGFDLFEEPMPGALVPNNPPLYTPSLPRRIAAKVKQMVFSSSN
ncbi:MAG: phytanoyl-CoA dioxygenase family protein [Cyanobium sp. CZS 25K]|nr:phytanoyl-CoA dioxygenase family protein [Cyanobium sp. CZS25K]